MHTPLAQSPSMSESASWSSLHEAQDAVVAVGGDEPLPLTEQPLLAGLPTTLVNSVRPDDVESVATEESQWMLVDAEDEVQSDIEKVGEECCSDAPLLSVLEPPAVRAPSLCAQLLNAAPLELYGMKGVSLSPECARDVTVQWAAALAAFPLVTSAACLGRVAFAAGACTPAFALARAAVANGGATAWPEATTLRLVAGDGHGFTELAVGALPPGSGAELVLDLSLGAAPPERSHQGTRSAWVLEDGNGEPFGPLLVLEVIWL